MRPSNLLLAFGLTLCCLLFPRTAHAAGPAAPAGSDVLIFVNGDQLTGTFVRSAGSNVIFRSSMAGELTLSWSSIKDLRSSREFVVLQKDQKLDRKSIPQIDSGSLTVKDGAVSLANGSTRSAIPVDRANVIDAQIFRKQALKSTGVFQHWSGAANLGALAILATQDTYSINTGITLARESPGVDYLPSRDRTLINYSSSYSRITQRQFPEAPLLPNLNISIYHADAEHDHYLASRVYALAQTAFDHNRGQGLDLQQIYGGGVGVTVIKRPSQTLDVRATLQYDKQEFLADLTSQENRTLVGSTLSATYLLRLPYNVVFRQEVQYLPAYNLRYAYSYSERNSLIYPLYKRLSVQLGTADSYLNNPPPITYPAAVNRPNSLQFTTGVSFSLK